MSINGCVNIFSIASVQLIPEQSEFTIIISSIFVLEVTVVFAFLGWGIVVEKSC